MPNQQTQGVQIYGREEGRFATLTEDGVKQCLDVSLGQSALPGFSIPPFDKIVASYPTSTQEVYQYYMSAVLVSTLTIDYTDTTKRYISQAEKS